jgi:murein tripeptide amidase MpaA
MIRISSTFDSGAIDVVKIAEEPDAVRIDLRIRRDSYQEFTQWFHFRLHGARGRRCLVRFLNAGQCTYPNGWIDYAVAASDDHRSWYRIPSTTYIEGILAVDVVPSRDDLYLAYFEPYDEERHLALIGRVAASPRARVTGLGQTADGRVVDCIEVSAGSGASAARRVWIIARQHPGETMAEWFVEGLLERLIDESDPLAREALRLADFHVVPNMNPDGSARGNLRTNARGVNLNREWLAPSAENCPEVHAVRAQIESIGVDLFLDVHGDEALPYVFIAGSEMLPDFSDRQRADQAAFFASFKESSPDFQDRVGYPSNKYSSDALKLASKWVGHRFGCLSMTLEMPFKDNADAPDPRVGWNGERSKRLGAASLHPIVAHLRRQAADGR